MKQIIAISMLGAAAVSQGSLAQEVDGSKVAASQVTGPVAIHPEYWVRAADRERSGSNGEGTTWFELTISPAGVVEQCRVTESSNIAVFDQLTCALIMKRAHFRPAKDHHGQAVASTWVNRVRWTRPGHTWQGPPQRADVSLTVNRLPESISSPARVWVRAVVGTDGRVENCEGQGKAELAVLNAVACRQVDAVAPDLIDHDQSGAPRRIMRSLLVQFSTH